MKTKYSNFAISLLFLFSGCEYYKVNLHDKEPTISLGLGFVLPDSEIGTNATPTVQISGIEAGDDLKLYSDSSCSILVASGISSSTTHNLITSTLPSGVTFLYGTARRGSFTTPCSSVADIKLRYVRNVCPSGYSYIPTLNHSDDFCVMAYEAKDDGSGHPESIEANTPWVNISLADAKSACTDLNALNGTTDRYDLISNEEWMVIARDIETVSENWRHSVPSLDHTVDTGCLKQGNVGDSDVCAYTNGSADFGSPSATREERAKLYLSNNQSVWDLSGNVWEWIDWSKAPGLQTSPNTCSAGWTSYDTFTCVDLIPSQYIPLRGFPMTSNLWGFGKIYGGSTGATLRSGAWNSMNKAGVFALAMDDPASMQDSMVGFRCVYRF